MWAVNSAAVNLKPQLQPDMDRIHENPAEAGTGNGWREDSRTTLYSRCKKKTNKPKKHGLQIPLRALEGQLQVCWELASAAKHLGVSCQTPWCQLPLSSKSLKTEVWAFFTFNFYCWLAVGGRKTHLPHGNILDTTTILWAWQKQRPLHGTSGTFFGKTTRGHKPG